MPDPDLDLNLLPALDALLAEGSVAGAARRLGLSASAMSRTLTRLRTATGDPLLVRAGRLMVLTPYAEQIRERTRDALHEARAVLHPSNTEPDLPTLRRTFSIRANDGFVEVFGSALIAAVSAVAPRVCLCFAPKAEKNATPLRDGSADLEIGVLGEMGPEVRVQALFRDRFVGVVRTGHPLASDEQPVRVERYVAFGHVVASRRGRTGGPVDDALAALGLARTVVAVVPSFPAALAVARTSDLIALVPASFFSAQTPASKDVSFSRDTLFAFDLPVATATITVSQMWHPRLEADPVHRWLRQLVLTVCRRETPL
ncbi:LysR family transcriptional regulator [Paraburkholderia sp. D15]|uniref:LysR family transcriptional regulator n=1 Tax=Paraburkholderia sp. D15 TaxID=2880218 RepID=UPI002478ACCE|nr:LysR family transcriptional regulator [Paraburkholderia sp. D15]WGS53914.1 LysR family transcriptional regulator [Paraburkholderia sp. D15]WKF60551.1 PCP degradation transcriptional activation protein [Paraburkholderia busanensis]